MKKLVLIASVALFLVASHCFAQKQIFIYTEPGFNPMGFTAKLVEALKVSEIGPRLRVVEQPALERLTESSVGDLVCQIVGVEHRCGGKTYYAMTFLYLQIDRDKSGSVRKIYLGSSTGMVSESTLDSDVSTYKSIIAGALVNH